MEFQNYFSSMKKGCYQVLVVLHEIYRTKKLGIMNFNQHFRVKFDMAMMFLFLY